jgi:hypothetical protein
MLYPKTTVMKNNWALLTLIVVALLFSACQKSDDENNGNNNPVTSNGTLSCAVNSQPYTFNDITAQVIVSSNAEDLLVTAFVDILDVQNQTYIQFRVFRKPDLIEGTYPFTNGVSQDTVVLMVFSELQAGAGANWDSEGNIGQVTITELDEENLTVSGTFSATLQLNNTSGGGSYPEEISITGGIFNKVGFLYND